MGRNTDAQIGGGRSAFQTSIYNSDAGAKTLVRNSDLEPPGAISEMQTSAYISRAEHARETATGEFPEEEFGGTVCAAKFGGGVGSALYGRFADADLPAQSLIPSHCGTWEVALPGSDLTNFRGPFNGGSAYLSVVFS